MKTYSPKPRDIERRWYVVDAQGAVLGRLASEVAKVLKGKDKPIYAPHADTGDHVVVINAREVQLTGGKSTKKVAYRHSGYPGGLTATGYDRLLAERPRFVVEKAIKGMLPHNRLGRSMARKLQVYEGPEHPHEAQKPVPLKLGEVPKWEGLPAPAPKRAQVVKAEAKPARRRSSATGKAPTAKAATAKPAPAKPVAADTESATKRTPAKTPAATATTAKRSTTKAAADKKGTAKAEPAKKRRTTRKKKDEEE